MWLSGVMSCAQFSDQISYTKYTPFTLCHTSHPLPFLQRRLELDGGFGGGGCFGNTSPMAACAPDPAVMLLLGVVIGELLVQEMVSA